MTSHLDVELYIIHIKGNLLYMQRGKEKKKYVRRRAGEGGEWQRREEKGRGGRRRAGEGEKGQGKISNIFSIIILELTIKG